MTEDIMIRPRCAVRHAESLALSLIVQSQIQRVVKNLTEQISTAKQSFVLAHRMFLITARMIGTSLRPQASVG